MKINKECLPIRRLILYATFLLIGIGTGLYLRTKIANQAATLDIEALITRGAVFRIYYNNQWSEPQASVVKPNTWTHYQFKIPSKITSLRFDPSDEAHAQASIRQIVVTGPTGIKQGVQLAQMQQWVGLHLHAQYQPDAKLVLLTTDEAPGYLMYPENIQVSSPMTLLPGFRLDSVTFFWCSIILAVGVVLIGTRVEQAKNAAVVTALIFLGLATGRLVALWRLSFPIFLPSVRHSVGAEVFSGFSKNNEVSAIDFGISASVLLVTLACFLWRWLVGKRFIPVIESRLKVANRTYWVLLLFAVCAWFTIPPLTLYLNTALQGSLSTDFDSQNVISWEYLAHLGRLPWRDYWFPYGGFYNRLAPLFPEFLYEYGHDLALIAMLLWCGLKALRGNVRLLFVCLVLFFVLQSLGVYLPGAGPRYLLSLSVVLLAASAAEGWQNWQFATLGAWCVYVVSQDFAQAVYAIPSVGCLIALGFFARSLGRRRAEGLRQILVGVVIFAAGMSLYILLLLKRSQFHEWWIFVSTLEDQAIYSAWPARVGEWLSGDGGLALGFLVLTAGLLICGVVHILISLEKIDPYQALPFCIGLLAWMQLQKQLIRPGIETQLLAIPCLGLFLLVSQYVQQKPNVWRGYWLAFGSALIFTCFILEPAIWNGTITPRLHQAALAPSDLKTIVIGKDWTLADRVYFTPRHFAFGNKNGADVLASLRSFVPIEEQGAIYVLGNDPVLYILFQKPIPFYTNIYNESPIYAQNESLEWLKKNRPRHVLWDNTTNEFSGVPNLVRIPLVFTYIVEHYRPEGSQDRYQILRSLESNEAFASEYWHRMLGPVTDLGYIPAASSVDQIANGTEDASVLLVNASAPRNGVRVSIPVRAGTYVHTVEFSERNDQSKYVIRLDRIPLLEAHRAAGAEIQLGEIKDPSLRASIRKLRLSEDTLY